MSDAPVSPIEVRRQIWESLVSMLRVYAHAASLNSEAYGVASTAEAVWVTYSQSALHVSYSSKSGDAQWRLEKPGDDVEGTFQIDDDGRLIFPEGAKELDEAAIHWVEALGRESAATIPA